jgi:hypothetical protein
VSRFVYTPLNQTGLSVNLREFALNFSVSTKENP